MQSLAVLYPFVQSGLPTHPSVRSPKCDQAVFTSIRSIRHILNVCSSPVQSGSPAHHTTRSPIHARSSNPLIRPGHKPNLPHLFQSKYVHVQAALLYTRPGLSYMFPPNQSQSGPASPNSNPFLTPMVRHHDSGNNVSCIACQACH